MQKLHLALFAFFSLLVGAGAILHAPWLDEAASWLNTRRAQSIADLLVIDNEGHPPFYYWILGLAQISVGTDFAVAKLPTIIFSVGCYYLVWARLPLSTIEKTLVSLSYFLLFQYGTFARGYIVGAFFILLFAALQDAPRPRPIASALALGAAALTHVMFAFVAISLSVLVASRWERAHERRAAKVFLLICGLLVFCALFLAWVSVDGSRIVEKWQETRTPLEAVNALLRNIAAPFFTGGLVQLRGGCLLAFPVLVLIALTFWRSRGALATVSAGFLMLALFQTFIYGGSSHLQGPAYLLFVAALAMTADCASRGAARLLLLVSAWFGVTVTLEALHTPYSDSRLAAHEIVARNLSRAAWMAVPDWSAISTFTILDRSFFGLECRCYVAGEAGSFRPGAPSTPQGVVAAELASAHGGTAYALVAGDSLVEVQGGFGGRVVTELVWAGPPVLGWREDLSIWRVSPAPNLKPH